jgi:hypothetical protein
MIIDLSFVCCHVFSRNSRGVRQTKGRTKSWKGEECFGMIEVLLSSIFEFLNNLWKTRRGG